MKKKNKGKKSLTAIGAVVAAGLTPGIVSGAPASQSSGPDVELTAADVVSINGEVFDFDELFAMREASPAQQVIRTVYGPRQPKVYGPVPPKNKDKVKDEDNDNKLQEEALLEQARLDSIRRAEEKRALVYGPPPVRYVSSNPEEIRAYILSVDKDGAIDNIQYKLRDFISLMTNIRQNRIGPDDYFTKDLNLSPEQQASLLKEVENSFGVQLTDDMLTQLNTVYRLARFIVEVISPIKE